MESFLPECCVLCLRLPVISYRKAGSVILYAFVHTTGVLMSSSNLRKCLYAHICQCFLLDFFQLQGQWFLLYLGGVGVGVVSQINFPTVMDENIHQPSIFLPAKILANAAVKLSHKYSFKQQWGGKALKKLYRYNGLWPFCKVLSQLICRLKAQNKSTVF